MKKLITLLLLVYISTSLNAQTRIKIILDTKKFINFECSLGADGSGGPSALPKVYMHSGLCTTGDLECKAQIIPYNSLAWQHVVGSWGLNPVNDTISQMVTVGNGIYTKTIILETYFSGPWVSTAWNDNHTIQSSPMLPGTIPYTLGLVFRDSVGNLTGRDNMCNDIFITNLDSANPKVVQSIDLSTWTNSPITIEKTILGINEIRNINFFSVAPNPVRDNIYVEFYLNVGTHSTVDILDNFGKKVTTLLEENLKPGKHVIKGNLDGLGIASGIYFITVRTDFSMVTEKIVVIK